MKTTRLTFLLVLSTALVASTVSLSAQTDTGRPQRPNREAILERFDTDGNGQLSEAERQVLRETMQAERGNRGGKGQRGRGPRIDWMQFDADGDGELTGGEREAAAEHLRAVISTSPRAMDRLDTDSDGILSDMEWQAARANWEQRMADGGPRGKRSGKGKCQQPGSGK